MLLTVELLHCEIELKRLIRSLLKIAPEALKLNRDITNAISEMTFFGLEYVF